MTEACSCGDAARDIFDGFWLRHALARRISPCRELMTDLSPKAAISAEAATGGPRMPAEKPFLDASNWLNFRRWWGGG